MSMLFIITIFPIKALKVAATSEIVAEKNGDTIHLKNDYFDIQVGKYGQITSLNIVGDKFPTNYVMNATNSPGQNTDGHQWMGELMFQTKVGEGANWTPSMTSSSDSARKVELDGNKVIVTYENAKENKGIKDFKLVETYSLEDNKLHWEIKIVNTNKEKLTVGDLGIPLAFNEIWPGGEEIYETRTVDHSFVGKNSSYVYVTRPSGLGQYLLMTPEVSTGAGFEYQDHWRTAERSPEEAAWCQDQAGWANGLNVFYIHSDVIKSTERGYLKNTSLELAAGESKTYAFNFTTAKNEDDMKKTLYNEGIIDAVAIPGMTFSVNMPAKMYLHTKLAKEDINFEVQCPHENGLHAGNPNTVSNSLPCTKNENTSINYVETKVVNGEQYHIYNISFSDLGQNNVIVKYDGGKKETVLQFYMMESVADALELHSDFMVEKTQWNAPGKIYDMVFDDWMMDTESKRGEFKGYWGWGDDWGLTHGEYLAEKNVYQPNVNQILALDKYLDVAIWNGLMREHQEDYKIHDFLMAEPNDTPTYRGYAYPHIYNTYFSMYKISAKYPEILTYKEKANTYLIRAYNIFKALYGEGVAYNWETGVMGELTTPDIIAALDKEGYYDEAQNIRNIMSKKYDNFKNTKYPYGSEYSYDNTGEEAVYTLAKLNNGIDKANSNSMMSKIDAKTRACRGLQPIWYHYANPTTNCGENWWNFQYTASLAGYCMDDWLRLQDNGKTITESALSQRMSYAAKLANLTAINSGQIDASPGNVGTVAWTYQSEMGTLGGQGTGGGKLHNGWRQMSGEADLGLFGALQILSSDVAVDPIFGLFGYGCKVSETDTAYEVTPLDGLYTKLNFINEKLYVELDRDQYTQAKVNKDRSLITLNIKNLAKTEHKSDIQLTGLKKGSYQILVDNKICGSFQALDDKTAIVSVLLPAAEGAVVTIKEGEALKNTVPVVEAGKDKEVYLSESFRLEGTVVDDGYPAMTLTNKWSVVSAPEGATAKLANDDRLITGVTVDKAGEYKFKLTVSDGELEANDLVLIKVLEDLPVPKVLANYTFDKLNLEKKQVIDEAGTNNAEIVGNLTFALAKDGNGVSMDGSFGGYVKLPEVLTKRVKDFTIASDVKLNGLQSSGTRLFEFGDMNNKYFYVSFINGNQLTFTMTNMKTGTNKTVNTGVQLGKDYWKNIEVTLSNNVARLYVDGNEIAKIADCEFTLAGLGDTQRNYIGRSQDQSIGYFNGLVDNFQMKSVAMTSDELKGAYGFTGERKIVSTSSGNVVTQVGKAPVLPQKIKALYSDGLYYEVAVTWDAISEASYAKAGNFNVSGKIEGSGEAVTATVLVVSGKVQNVALTAVPSAIINTPSDLGGVVGLNDNFDPTSSRDTSHGAWHNWRGDQGGKAWVQYDWQQETVLTGMDAYYFSDGNFAPVSVEIQYRDKNGAWVQVSNAKGLGVELNKYNYTTFDPVVTTGLRMTMTPKTLGCGVIEWKVYGYSDKIIVTNSLLKVAIAQANGLKAALFTKDSWSALQEVVKEAQNVVNNTEATQEIVDNTTAKVNNSIASLVSLDKNIAYTATKSTSYCSPWETVGAVNDNVVSQTSAGAGVSHYGTWGNDATEEWVTYTWGAAMDITSIELFLFNDGGGILSPKSYKYEYLDASGKWVEVPNVKGYGLELDKFNETTFNKISTTALKITMVKSGDGVGIIEWRVIGEKSQTVVVNKEILQGLVDAAAGKIKAEYTEESWKSFVDALEAATNILKDANATQEIVDNAKAALETAMNGLVKIELPVPVVDKSSLEAMVNTASTKVVGDYTKDSWKAFSDVLLAARNVLKDTKSTQEAVDKAKASLKSAMNGLVKLEPVPEPVPVVDKSSLQALVSTAAAKVETDYTQDSWKAFSDVLSRAKVVLSDEKVTQEAVNEQANALQKVIDDLARFITNTEIIVTENSDNFVADKDNLPAEVLVKTGSAIDGKILVGSGILILLAGIGVTLFFRKKRS
jgi:hypothetical protein